jgi:hypothetical protein
VANRPFRRVGFVQFPTQTRAEKGKRINVAD